MFTPPRLVSNSTSMTELRQEFLDGGQPDGCRRCWSEEDAGIISKRLRSVEQYEKQNINFYTNEADKVRFLDLKLGNICNLKCRMCNPYASNQWVKEWNANTSYNGKDIPNEERIRLSKMDWPENEKTWENLFSIAHTVEEIYLTGGEPTIIKEQHKLPQSPKVPIVVHVAPK